MASSQVPSAVPIALRVAGVGREFLSLGNALNMYEDFSLQLSPTTVEDEFARFKVLAQSSVPGVY